MKPSPTSANSGSSSAVGTPSACARSQECTAYSATSMPTGTEAPAPCWSHAWSTSSAPTRNVGPQLSLTWGVGAALVAAVALLATGSAMVYPFEMDTVVTLSGNHLVATHYGLYNTVSGLGITLGNLATGALWDFAERHDALWLTWTALAATGLACAASIAALARNGQLAVRRQQPATT